jgi:hypothetical protein
LIVGSPKTSPVPGRSGAHAGENVYEAGIGAWERGDWLGARRALRAAIESQPRKEERLEAGRILHALDPDRFALGLALLFLLVLATLFAWLIA